MELIQYLLFDFCIDQKLMYFCPFFPIWISRTRSQILKYFLIFFISAGTSFQPGINDSSQLFVSSLELSIYTCNSSHLTNLALVGTPSFERVGIIVVIVLTCPTYLPSKYIKEKVEIMDEMNGMGKLVEGIYRVGDIIRKLRTENKNLKRKLSRETKAKDEEINIDVLE